MRKVFAWCLIVTVIALTGCENEKNENATRDGFKTYTSDSLGISIDYPDNFEAKPNIKPEIPIAFYEVNNDTSNYLFHPNILFFTEPIPPVKMSTAEYVQASRTQLKLMMQSQNPNFDTYGLDSMDVNGLKVTSYKYDIQSSNGNSFTSKMYITLLEGRALQIQSTTVSGNFSSYEDLFDSVIQSLKVKK